MTSSTEMGPSLVSLQALPPRDQLEALVAASSRTHGHLCPGQVIGVRMAILGLGLLGYPCPLPYPEIKNIVGVVEVERCLADAVATASGLRFGRGSLKLIDLGLLAASFGEISSGRAVRVLSKDQAREMAAEYAPNASSPQQAQIDAYMVMPNDELFEVSWIKLNLPASKMPGARPEKVACDKCGVLVRSGQARIRQGRALCPVCAGDAYFSLQSLVEL